MGPLTREILAEYGEDVTTAEGAARWRAWPPDHRIGSPGEYVAAVRRLAARLGIELPTNNGRLLAAGFGRIGPRKWITTGALSSFLAYWRRAAARPDRVGSPYNPPPDLVAASWTRRVPPAGVRSGAVVAAPRGPRSGRRARRLSRIAIATSRTSAALGVRRWGSDGRARPITSGALDALGRLSPELQRAALWVSGYRPFWDRDTPFGARDLDWPAIARVHAAMRAPLVRAAWGAGRGATSASARAAPGVDLAPGWRDPIRAFSIGHAI